MIYKHINTKIEFQISNYVNGFRKSHETQDGSKLWKQAIDKGEYIFVMHMDLFKIFGTIKSELLLEKLSAYSFSRSTLNLFYSYLKNRKQKVVIINKKNSFEVVIAGVPQGSIDGPLLINLFINDLVLFLYTIVLRNYADGSSIVNKGFDSLFICYFFRRC